MMGGGNEDCVVVMMHGRYALHGPYWWLVASYRMGQWAEGRVPWAGWRMVIALHGDGDNMLVVVVVVTWWWYGDVMLAMQVSLAGGRLRCGVVVVVMLMWCGV